MSKIGAQYIQKQFFQLNWQSSDFEDGLRNQPKKYLKKFLELCDFFVRSRSTPVIRRRPAAEPIGVRIPTGAHMYVYVYEYFYAAFRPRIKIIYFRFDLCYTQLLLLSVWIKRICIDLNCILLRIKSHVLLSNLKFKIFSSSTIYVIYVYIHANNSHYRGHHSVRCVPFYWKMLYIYFIIHEYE